MKAAGEALRGVGKVEYVRGFESGEEFRGRTFPVMFFVGEGGHLSGQSVGTKRNAHLRFGDAERRRGGEGPLQGVRESRGELGAGVSYVAKGAADCGTGGGEERRASAFELDEDFALGSTLRRGDVRQLDGDGMVGDGGIVGGRGAIIGSSQDDGALEEDGERIGSVGGLIKFERRAGGQAAKGG